MTEKEYRQHPAISRSELWKMHESPEKFKWYKDNPQEPTPALLFGQVVHKMILQPEGFDDDFVVAPDVDRRTKAGKEAWSDFLDSVGEKTVIAQDLFNQSKEMSNVLFKVPMVQTLLNGQKELPYFWQDEMTGEGCKCRVDCITEIKDTQVIVDYKTCTDASNDGFMRDAIKYGYDLQAAMYSEGVEKNTGKKPLFVFIAQEKNPPYAVNIFQADEAFVQHGMDVYRELMGVYHYCKTNDKWYGYLGREQIINNLQLPAWMAKE